MDDPSHEVSLPEWELERLSELVSKRVDDKLLARFGRWVVFNLIVLGGIAGGGVVAFFNLRGDVEKSMTINAYQDAKLAEAKVEASSFRAEICVRLDRFGEQLNSISNQLAAHNGRVASGAGK